ncbi:MAG: CinA family protein, partial [Anaerolineales bacterium]
RGVGCRCDLCDGRIRTGGLIGHLITNVPGSSIYYLGSITAYSNEVKVRLLKVSWETLARYGAVSEETALEMALGVRNEMAADIGISVTGIAGPGGATSDKPVGTTWIGLSAVNYDQSRHYLFQGDRLAIKEKAAKAALQLVVDFLS